MEISRNQYFLIGMVLLLLGLQAHMIDTVNYGRVYATAGRADRPSLGGHRRQRARRSSPRINRW